MDICVNLIMGRNSPKENFLKCYNTLKKTDGDFSLCVVNSSNGNLREIENDEFFKDVNIINNRIDPGFSTLSNQGLYYSMSSGFDLSISINASYAIIVNPNWLNEVIRQFSDEASLGGTVWPVKISNSENVRKVLYGVSPNGDIGWLSKHLNRYMVSSFVDGNIFIIKNSALKDIPLPNTKYCEDKTYGLYLSFLLLKQGHSFVNIESIYSSWSDSYRYDIFSAVKEGAGIVYPVMIDSVRDRFRS